VSFAHHDNIELVAGDSWLIPGVLTDHNGDALDLTTATFEWELIDSGGYPVAISADVTVTDAPRGAVSIALEANDTAGLEPGFYMDALRVEFPNSGRSTVWRGQIAVAASRSVNIS
jgi:hypothetical protein